MDLPTIHLVLRATARISLILFLPAFAAHGLHALSRTQASAFLARHRERFLLLFAGSHTVHLSFVITLAATMGWPAFIARFTWVAVLVGGSIFVLIYCLTADAAYRLVSGRPLLRSGFMSFAQYAIWTIFALSYVPRATPRHPLYLILAIPTVMAMIVRIAGGRARRAKAASAA